MATIVVKHVKDTLEEKTEVERDNCDFAVLDRSTSKGPSHPTDYSYYVSTKKNSDTLLRLDGWTLIMPGLMSNISRFGVMGTKENLLTQIAESYAGCQLKEISA